MFNYSPALGDAKTNPRSCSGDKNANKDPGLTATFVSRPREVCGSRSRKGAVDVPLIIIIIAWCAKQKACNTAVVAMVTCCCKRFNESRLHMLCHLLCVHDLKKEKKNTYMME